jgi:hypothetical protein
MAPTLTPVPPQVEDRAERAFREALARLTEDAPTPAIISAAQLQRRYLQSRRRARPYRLMALLAAILLAIVLVIVWTKVTGSGPPAPATMSGTTAATTPDVGESADSGAGSVTVPLPDRVIQWHADLAYPDDDIVFGPSVTTITVLLTGEQAERLKGGAWVTCGLFENTGPLYEDSFDVQPGATAVTFTIPEGALSGADVLPTVALSVTLLDSSTGIYSYSLSEEFSFDHAATATDVTLDLGRATVESGLYWYDEFTDDNGVKRTHDAHWGDRVTVTIPDSVVMTDQLLNDRVHLVLAGERDTGSFTVAGEVSAASREVRFSLPASPLCVEKCVVSANLEFTENLPTGQTGRVTTAYIHLSVT